MKFRLLLLLLLCTTLLFCFASCKDEEDGTTSSTQSTTQSTTTSTTTSTSSSTTAPAPVIPEKTVADWFKASLKEGYVYRLVVKNGENELSLLVKHKNGMLTVAYDLVENTQLIWKLSDYQDAAYLHVSGAGTGVRFSKAEATLICNEFNNWLSAAIPTLDLTTEAILAVNNHDFSFENSITYGTAALTTIDEAYILASMEVTDKQSQKSVTATLDVEEALDDTPNIQTLSNEMAPLLAKLLLLDRGYVQVEGEGSIELSNGEAYQMAIENSGKAPLLEGGKWQLSAELVGSTSTKVARFFYGEENGKTILRAGDVLYTLTPNQFEEIGASLILSLLSYLAEGQIPILDLSQWLPSVENNLIPELSDWPTPLQRASLFPNLSTLYPFYFDQEGNLHFSVTLGEMGALSGMIRCEDNGISFSLSSFTFTVSNERFTVAGEFAATATPQKAYTAETSAPVEIDVSAVTNLLTVLGQSLVGHPYYQAEGQLAVGMTIPVLGQFKIDNVYYTVLTDTNEVSLTLSIDYPTLLSSYLMLQPNVPERALVLSNTYLCKLYIKDGIIYLSGEACVKYMVGFTLTEAKETVDVKLTAEEAYDHMDTLLSYVLNLDIDALGSSLMPDDTTPPEGDETTPPEGNDTPENEGGETEDITSPEDFSQDRFALSITESGDSYQIQADMGGISYLLRKWNMSVALPEELDGVMITLTVKAAENGVSYVELELTTSLGISMTLSGNITYPEELENTIAPSEIAENSAYVWLFSEQN